MWTEIQVKGSVPSPRAGHAVDIIQNKVFIFGGGDGKRFLLPSFSSIK